MAVTKLSRLNDRLQLIDALTSLSANTIPVQHFLEGLSSDELRYIAAYFGAAVLEPNLKPSPDRALAARRVEQFQQMSSGDSLGRTAHASHKMILLWEFLGVAQTTPAALVARAGAA